MHIAMRKVYMSILTIMLVTVTMFATTYAWVGILTYSHISEFDLNLKTQDLESDYFLSISASGEENTFSDIANSSVIKEQILLNMGKDLSIIPYDKQSDTDMYYQVIDELFDKSNDLYPVTTSKTGMLNNEFYGMDNKKFNSITNEKTTHFFRFDLYLSIEAKKEEMLTDDVNAQIDIILPFIEETLQGSRRSIRLGNNFEYPLDNLYALDIPSNKISNDQIITVNSASATRLAIAVYDPILRGESYQGTEQPSKLVIYQGGTKTPTYDATTDTYSFGGILPEEYNLALVEHKKKYNLGTDKLNVPTEMINRGDLELIEENKVLVDGTNGFGIVNGKKTVLKLTVFFWFEGWDSDCFEVINNQNVNINLTLSTGEIRNV